jgi:hypothetical protein
MLFCIFGPKGFTVSSDKIMTFEDFKFATSLETQKQENLGRKPSTQIKNVNLSTFSIKVKVDATLGVHPSAQIDEWINVLSQAKPYPFLLNGSPFLNTKWLLVNVTVDKTSVDKYGNILSAELNLSFDEFASKAAATVSSTSSSAASGTKIGSSKAENTDSVYEALRPKQKSELKVSSLSKLRSNEQTV